MLQLDTAERVRRQVSPRIALKPKADLGQYMTLSGVARFMAGMFQPSNHEICRLLDAGAGLGAVSCAFLDRWLTGGINFAEVEATAYEIDARFSDHLKQHLASYSQGQSRGYRG